MAAADAGLVVDEGELGTGFGSSMDLGKGEKIRGGGGCCLGYRRSWRQTVGRARRTGNVIVGGRRARNVEKAEAENLAILIGFT